MPELAVLAVLAALESWLPFIWKVLLVAAGIGLVIFVHELGHFLVAKKVGIRVETFSLGFGPRVLGFRRGDTDYRISLVPLGGYVKMAGENPDDPHLGREDEYSAKSVGQRAAVISAGVIMNTIFAVIGFLIAFKVGVKMHVPVVGTVHEGAPAHGVLERGDRILRVDGEEVLDFKDIGLAAAFADGPLRLEVERDGKVIAVEIAPRRGMGEEFQRLGIEPIEEITRVEPGSAAEKGGLREKDQILGVGGSARFNWLPDFSLAELSDTVDLNPGRPVDILVWRPSGRETVTVVPDAKPERSFGITLALTPVVVKDVTEDSPAEQAGLEPGDRILTIGGAKAMIDEVVERIKAAKGKPVRVEIERRGERLTKELTPKFDESHGRAIIGITFDGSVVAAVAPGSSAAKAGVTAGDRLLSVGEGPAAPQKLLDRVAASSGDAKVEVRWERPSGEKREGEIVAAVVPDAFYGDLGVAFAPATFVHRAPGIVEPVLLGLDRTVGVIEQIFLMLAGFFKSQISTKTLGGPVQIGQAAYHFAGYGIGTLIYFLALLSINLAVLNILPIPILDGGHLLFLAIEKVKGSPVSLTVQGYAQWVGLVLLLGLMVFVTKNDIFRLLKPG